MTGWNDDYNGDDYDHDHDGIDDKGYLDDYDSDGRVYQGSFDYD